MKLSALMSSTAIGLTAAACAFRTYSYSKSSTQPFILAHVSVVNIYNGTISKNSNVKIENGKITKVTNEALVEDDVRTIDASGKFLIPGLRDMHVHTIDERTFYPLYVANGVIGVREMFSPKIEDVLKSRREVREKKILGPDSYLTGKILEGPMTYWPGTYQFLDPTDGRHAVDELKSQGADFVKTYSMLTREQYFQIADESKKVGIDFEGHVPHAVRIAEASDAGQRSMEHLYNVAEACSQKEIEFFEERNKQAQVDAPKLKELYAERGALEEKLKQTSDTASIKEINSRLAKI